MSAVTTGNKGFSAPIASNTLKFCRTTVRAVELADGIIN